MTLKFTILGCGSSGGVPRPALGWGECDPKNPKNRRRRASLLVERRPPPKPPPQAGEGRERGPREAGEADHAQHGGGGAGITRVLVDTPPDLREQLLDAEVDRLDGVLYSHDHADHTHGIDDLRALSIKQRQLIDVYFDDRTAEMMRARFGYCFQSPPGSAYPPILRERRLAAGRPISIAGQGGPITALPFLQAHGDTVSFGFRFGSVAYSCDLSGLPPESATALAGLDVWIVDALRERPHPSHFSVADALAWIERLKPRRAILINLHAELDYEALRGKLPPHVEPAFDGMTFVIAEPATTHSSI